MKAKNGWISVKDRLPKYSQEIPGGKDTPVLVWPDTGTAYGAANYGVRGTGTPEFYHFFGAALKGVRFWQYLPEGPYATKKKGSKPCSRKPKTT